MKLTRKFVIIQFYAIKNDVQSENSAMNNFSFLVYIFTERLEVSTKRTYY